MFRGRMDLLGWKDAPRASLAQWDDLVRFADGARRDGLTHTVVCGMGGSSLAPQVLAASFGRPGLSVLDSTDPAAVLAVAHAPDFARTLFVISSKSGSTVETLSFYRYLATRAEPRRFVAITDPGSPLEALARERGFRAVFPHPPDVGGRYAALTVVGMLPAALSGIDGRVLLERALAVDPAAARTLGARLGVNAFDQPDVEEAKALARAELAEAQGSGVGAPHAAPLPTLTPEVLRRSARPGDYLAILAYLAPTPDVTAKLQAVRAAWGRALGCATTLGFGPRYLHSTGQLHKGGPNTGLFLVVTTDDAEDAAIPETGFTFGRLKRAQARGDIRALLARGRRVAHVHLARPEDVAQDAALRPT